MLIVAHVGATIEYFVTKPEVPESETGQGWTFALITDVYSDGGISDGAESAATEIRNSLSSAGIETNTSVETSIGLGLRAGAHYFYPKGYSIGGSLGGVIAPTVSLKQSNNAFSIGSDTFGPGEVETQTSASYARPMVEASYPIFKSRRSSLRIWSGAGVAFGWAKQTVEGSGSSNLLFGNSTSRESWSGFTWEIGPTFAFVGKKVDFEFGVRYARFPTMEETAELSEMKWDPFSASIGVRFK